MKKAWACLIIFFAVRLAGQIDPDLLKRLPTDTANSSLNMDAIYRRPMLALGNTPLAIGGYLEANWQKSISDGISEGHQFQFRRFSLFMASTIHRNIKFMSELEFEDGAKEISLEYAAIDFELNPLLNLRGGIILNPIGAFNQNHDGPKWEFIDRPLASTQLLPATWNNAGIGLYGKKYSGKWMYGYEIYLSNGLNQAIIDNAANKTNLSAAKEDNDRFEESQNGQMMLTAKMAVRQDLLGEIGLSYMGGIYNKFQDDGLVLDRKRRCDVLAVDYNNTFLSSNTSITGEWAWIFVNIPATYTQQYGRKQAGGFVDIVQTVWKKKTGIWPDALLNLALRLEYLDWNKGVFKETGGKIGESAFSFVPALSFRPSPQTVIRLNYRYQYQRDLLNNPPAKMAVFSIGFSTYF